MDLFRGAKDKEILENNLSQADIGGGDKLSVIKCFRFSLRQTQGKCSSGL